MPDRWTQRAPITGIIAVLLLAAGFIVGGETPDFDAKTSEILDYYGDQTEQVIVSVLALYGAVLLVFFAGSLRSALRRAESLSLLVLVGGALLGMGWTIFAGINFTLTDLVNSDNVGRVDPGALQTLNALNSDFFFPVVLGTTVWLFSVALAILRSGGLPRWLGWAALVIAILSVTPVGFIAIPLSGLWIIVAAVIMMTGGANGTPAAASQQEPVG